MMGLTPDIRGPGFFPENDFETRKTEKNPDPGDGGETPDVLFSGRRTDSF
jgi:hypothetical protein